MSAVVRPAPPDAATVRTKLTPQLLHDLRSPLNQIIGFSEMLSEEADGPRRDAVVLDLLRVSDAGRRILALLEENFTTTADVTAAQPSPVASPDVSAFKGDDRDLSAPHRAAVRHAAAAAPGLLLVVDDDEANRDVLTRRLERQGHRVQT
ncbi:MAG TPA: histidine kinase dimerization/phospho-acceptor domain-containing protein, partial [Thermoanaerobaculia bacterium]|nr:histidine kinase dimerization/phospho-acceptor domain-containing protein [Thermoanaerobaculia bacterium]